MYVCGITPYDATHLGHAATMITFDVLNRVWRDNGFDVNYVQNVTDIDDPLFERADRDGVDWADLGRRETALFREDMEALSILAPRSYIGAVESMDEIVALVERLSDLGAAYRLEDGSGDHYFPVAAAPGFGGESRYDRATMLKFFAERGGDPDRASGTHWTRCCGGVSVKVNRVGRRLGDRGGPVGTLNVLRSRCTISEIRSMSRVAETILSFRITRCRRRMSRSRRSRCRLRSTMFTPE